MSVLKVVAVGGALFVIAVFGWATYAPPGDWFSAWTHGHPYPVYPKTAKVTAHEADFSTFVPLSSPARPTAISAIDREPADDYARVYVTGSNGKRCSITISWPWGHASRAFVNDTDCPTRPIRGKKKTGGAQ